MLQEAILNKIKGYLVDYEEFSKLDFSKLILTIPKNSNHGDFSTNFALVVSSELKTDSKELAEKIANILLDKNDSTFNSINVIAPGFINFNISLETYYYYLKEINLSGKNYGSTEKRNEKVLIEFVSANPTGYLHLGHLRNAAVGDSVARILSFSGYDVTKEYYLNDYGTQINLLGESLQARVFNLLDIKQELPEGGYKGEYLINLAKILLSEKDEKFLLNTDIEFFSDFAKEYLIEEIIRDLETLNISFDSWFSEKKDIHESKYLEETKKILNDHNSLYLNDNAEWIKTSEFGDDKDWVVKKSDGTSTYFMNDIAYHQRKYNRDYDLLINVWGADHHSHISRLRAAMDILSNDSTRLVFILIQFVRLIKDNKDISMSKRSGTYTTIKDLLSEFDKDLVRFLMISRSSDSHFDFDLDKCRSDSEENPVFYIQYANARINSIMEKSQLKKIDFDNLHLLSEEKEIILIKKLLHFPEVVKEAATNYAPHKIAFYLQDLSSEFHHYYKSTKVLVEDKETLNSRLALLSLIKIVLVNGLNLLGVSSPDKM